MRSAFTEHLLYSEFMLGIRDIVEVKKKREEWLFLFPSPENKEYKENSEQAWTFLVFLL